MNKPWITLPKKSRGLIKPLLTTFLILLSIYSFSQEKVNTDSLRIKIEAEMLDATEKFYYDNMDSALYYMNNLEMLAISNQLWENYLNVALQKIWVAEHHNNIDSLYKFIDVMAKKITTNNLDTLQNFSQYNDELIYARGMMQYQFGNFSLAIDQFKKLIPNPDSRIDDSLLVYDTYVNIGHLYYNLEDYQNANNYYLLAKPWIPFTHEMYDVERDYEYQKSYMQYLLGRSAWIQAKKEGNRGSMEKAHHYFTEAFTMIEKRKSRASMKSFVNRLYGQFAEYFMTLKNYDSAIHYSDLILELQIDNDRESLTTYLLAALIQFDKGDFELSESLYLKALALAKSHYSNKHYLKARALNGLGNIQVAKGKWEEGLSYYQTALSEVVPSFDNQTDYFINPDLESEGMMKEWLEILVLKGKAFRRGFEEDSQSNKQLLISAVENYNQAVGLIDLMHRSFQSAESRQYLSAKALSIYEGGIEASYVAFEAGFGDNYLDIAFSLIEKNKSRQVLEAVMNSNAKKFANIDEELLGEEAKLKGNVSMLYRKLFNDRIKDEKLIADLRKELFYAREKLNEFVASLEKTYPKYHQLKYNIHTISLAELKEKIGSQQLVVEYFYGDQSIFEMGISKESVYLKKVENKMELETKLGNYIANISHLNLDKMQQPGKFTEFVQEGHYLYNHLIGDVVNGMDRSFEELLIIPDGRLGYLSFGALLSTEKGANDGMDFRSIDYLIKSQEIGYDYSSTLHYMDNFKSKHEAIAYKYIGYAPSYSGPQISQNISEQNTYGNVRSGKFSPLTFNKREISNVNKVFDGLEFLDIEASEKTFKTYAGRSAIIHLSMHGFVDDRNPLFSGLVFSQEAAGIDDNDDDDGFLYTYEIYNMNLHSELAILSACQTGLGELARGEGIMSMGRAFKFAGCPSITMSLWNANDVSSAAIVEAYSTYLSKGMQKDKALQQAKIDFINESDNLSAHPFFWSTFIALGDDQPISATNGLFSNQYIWLIISGFVLVVLFALYSFNRRKTV